MSEPVAKVRLVSCPKCGNFLPELTDYSVYQCGGCGAVLRADQGNGVVDPLFENSNEERVQRLSERLYEKSENLGVSGMSRMNVGRVAEDDTKSNSSSSNRAERRRFLHDTIENHGAGLMTPANRWVVDGGMEIDDNMNGISHAKMDRSFEETRSRMGNENGLQRSGEQWDRRFGRISEMDGFPRPARHDVVGTSYSTSKYLEEGPLNYQMHGSYGYREPPNKRNDLDGSDNVGYLGEDRAEILRKLEELKVQLIRSGDVVDKPKDKFPVDRRMVPLPPDSYEEFFADGYSAMNNRRPVPYSIPDHHAARPSHVNHYTETSPFVNRHGFYHPPRSSGHIQEFGDPSSSQFLQRGPFQQKPPHTQFSSTYVDGNVVPVDSYDSYPPSISRHHPSCSCFHCYNQYGMQGQGQVPLSAYGAKRFSDVTKDPAFYHHAYQNAVGLQDYREMYNRPTSSKSSNPPSHHRWPSDLKSEASGFVRNRPARILVTTDGRQCQPVAGGAPFLACQKCHQLLQLPKKVVLNGGPKKMRCGACSVVIEVTVDSKSLNVTVSSEADRTSDNFNQSSNENLNEWSSNTPGNPHKVGVSFASDDFDSAGYKFQSMDRELGSKSVGVGSSNKSGDLRSPHSAFSSSLDKEQSLGNASAVRNNSNSPESMVKGKEPRPPAGSPLQDHFDYSNKFHVPKRSENGNRSGRYEMDKMTPAETALRQNSVEDASATEIEISSNEYSNTGTSLDSGEASREGNHLRAINKTAESFFASMIKKSYRDGNTDDGDEEKANVTINGYLISDRLVKKAERLAGPIRPGHYWYDFRAGFWGVMGGPCLGIIPPFIVEFNYSMPENCAGGSTGVFVNGRELHPKDSKLLGSRGLPTDRDGSYILEISGRILDAETGEELESLGKLAPTIERLKRGFGMKDPTAAA